MFDQCGTRSPSNPLFRKKMSVRAQQFWSPTRGRSVPVTAAVRVARSGGTTGLCVGHVAPEAADGGPIAFLRDGDRIRLDVAKNTVDVLIDHVAAALQQRCTGQVRQAGGLGRHRSGLRLDAGHRYPSRPASTGREG